MLQQRGTTTDRLANVIQVLQLGCKTGMLRVERGEGTRREEGMMTFVQGQVTQAYAGQQSGQAALAWLNSWGACRFTFVPGQTERTTGPLTPLPRTGSLQTPYAPSAPLLPLSEPGLAEKHLSGDAGYAPSLPYRTRPIGEALHILERARCSRMHRRFLLLIDGQKTPEELERLLGRTQYEVQQVLHDLMVLGLIGLS
jgi:Domain of unknown function (DUF4388)